MKILGIIGRSDIPTAHDGSAALIIDNKIKFAIEQERLTRHRYAEGEGAADAAQACLEQARLQLSDIDYIAYGWLEDLKSGTKVSQEITVSDELTPIILPPKQFGYKDPPPINFVQHHHTYAAVTFFTSGFDSAGVLVIDGQGEGVAISLFHAQGDKIEPIETYPVINSMGMFYGAASARAGFGWHPGPGKLMGLAPFGQIRQPIDFKFDPDTGHFLLPVPIQKAINESSTPPTADDVGMFWVHYFEDYFFPYRQNWDTYKSYYDATNYVDFAASVQKTLENLAHNLALRLKKLTGEKNLVLSGGCALNCNMNSMLSESKLFDNLYVFPAANDAGCSIGAALALSNTIKSPKISVKRLISPGFGRTYTNQEIIKALTKFGFQAEKLSDEEIVDHVAQDLADNKIITWFRGQDEFGPRALGRRSFLSNPSQRETLGRLNKIKGREMWRPLAPSILREKANLVLEGDLEPGLHRYMLGIAIVKSEWRSKIPTVVHVDFSTRSHLVEKEQDGIYWSLINKFYETTGIPLVCNTSLNIAGEPIVHKPEQVLEIYTKQDDVQTLVIENFYLTKTESLYNPNLSS